MLLHFKDIQKWEKKYFVWWWLKGVKWNIGRRKQNFKKTFPGRNPGLLMCTTQKFIFGLCDVLLSKTDFPWFFNWPSRFSLHRSIGNISLLSEIFFKHFQFTENRKKPVILTFSDVSAKGCHYWSWAATWWRLRKNKFKFHSSMGPRLWHHPSQYIGPLPLISPQPGRRGRDHGICPSLVSWLWVIYIYMGIHGFIYTQCVSPRQCKDKALLGLTGGFAVCFRYFYRYIPKGENTQLSTSQHCHTPAQQELGESPWCTLFTWETEA